MEKLTELERWQQELQDEAHTLIDFFCEDKETMKLDECLQIFRDFCVKFNKAVQVWLMASPVFSEWCGVSVFLFQTQPSALGRKTVRHFHGFREGWCRPHRQGLGWDSSGLLGSCTARTSTGFHALKALC